VYIQIQTKYILNKLDLVGLIMLNWHFKN